jgi:site-specific recombinase XerD
MTNPINMDDFVRQVQSAATGGVIHAEGTLVGKTPTRPADEVLFDVCGRKRSPATLRHFRLGMKPPNYGKRYPATPPTEEEVLAVLGACQRNPNGRRCYALTVLLWRSGLRVSEGLALEKHDLRPAEGTVFVRCGKGGKTRMSGMDEWAFEQVMDYADWRYGRYPGTCLFPVVQGPTKGQPWSASAYRAQLRDLAAKAGVQRRLAPHQLRHAHACELTREGVSVVHVSRQLGHSNIATTTTYLGGIGVGEAIEIVHARRAPGELVSA